MPDCLYSIYMEQYTFFWQRVEMVGISWIVPTSLLAYWMVTNLGCRSRARSKAGKSIFPSSLTGNVYTAIPLFFSDAHALPTEWCSIGVVTTSLLPMPGQDCPRIAFAAAGCEKDLWCAASQAWDPVEQFVDLAYFLYLFMIKFLLSGIFSLS